MCIFNCGKVGRAHFKQQGNGQGAFWTAGKQAGHCALLKMPRGNTIYISVCAYVCIYIVSVSMSDFMYILMHVMCVYVCVNACLYAFMNTN